jgi:hypothetical protein
MLIDPVRLKRPLCQEIIGVKLHLNWNIRALLIRAICGFSFDSGWVFTIRLEL